MTSSTLSPPAAARSINILVVDDEPNNLRSLSAMLQRDGYTVRQAINGATALNTVQALSPDLILLDIRMPGLDGYEVCAQLKADPSTADIPVIFLSALDAASDQTRAFAVGGADYITKPFKSAEVLIRIQHQLTLRSQHQQLQQLTTSLQRLNLDLERQVKARTLELEQTLALERTLKRISDRVRDTLDSNEILQTSVVELATALGCRCCDAAIYSPDRLTSSIRYQYTAPGQNTPAAACLPPTDVPEIYEQLYQKYSVAFCSLPPAPSHSAAILVCPLFDDRVEECGLLGDLWLFKSAASSFSEQEIRLAEQVANQCAIALRQAQLYEAAQQQVQALERLNRLKDDFLSTISHELRTPLATMKLSLQLLNTFVTADTATEQPPPRPVPMPEQAIHYLEILQDECDRELKLVQDLLDLQQVEAEELDEMLTPIQINDWLQHLTEAFLPSLQAQRQHLKLDLSPSLPTMALDVASLSRVMTELLTNARKYTPANETIMVATQQVGDRLCLSVCNTGVTVAPEELPRLFDKFYRIPSHDPWQHGGTGLGLALVKRLVEQMGGTITATSQPQTLCFTVRLPLHKIAGQSYSFSQLG